MISTVPPALIFVFGAFLVPLLSGNTRRNYLLLLPVIGLINLFSTPVGTHWVVNFLDFDLVFGKIDKLSLVWGYIFHIIAFLSVLYAIHVKNNLEQWSTFFYAGSALGVVFSGDLISLFCFWEMMTIGSACLILARRTKKSYEAAFRYTLVHVAGGLILLAGIVMHITATGSVEFKHLGLDSPGAWFIFIGFGVNCAWPILHAWLPDAYPEATFSGSVVLSTFTTKTAVYVLARSFAGADPLILIGATMTVFPIFYALVENDLRKVLSYSLIDQVGFMVVGIGVGTELALNGVAAHAFCHILYKALLFMSMGSVLHMTGKIKATELGGLYKSMPLTSIFCMVGAASIAGLPFFNGFISKTMIIDAAATEHYSLAWLALMFASASAIIIPGIKVPYLAFFGKDSSITTSEPPHNMVLAMGITAFLCVFVGIIPSTLYSILPFPVTYEPYTIAHLVTKFQLLLFAAVACMYLMKSGIYPEEKKNIYLDADWFYRKGGKLFVMLARNPVEVIDKYFGEIYMQIISKPGLKLAQVVWKFFDVAIVDGLVNLTARVARDCGEHIRHYQTGHVRNYALMMVIGFVLILFFL